MSVFSANINHRSFVWQISILCFVLGLLLAAAAFTTNQITRAGRAPNRAGFHYGSEMQVAMDKATEYEDEIKKLNQQKTELENKLAKGTNAASALNKELQESKFLAGLTDAIGPGIQVTLTDSHKQPLIASEQMKLNILIHDQDIANVINEMKAAGAEAISVNDKRVVATTSIRCVGPVIQISGVPTAPPYVIQAIGDPEALYGGLKTQGGVLTELTQFDPDMAKIEKKSLLRLPAYAGSTHSTFAHPPAPTDGKREREAAEGTKSESK
ncbi:MAG TPA: DUF881 domain-containing protein [Chthonomonadaceae bacterium]|nr:DUF881 domain-containing protein [Chthonomonadaceae bacterium]